MMYDIDDRKWAQMEGKHQVCTFPNCDSITEGLDHTPECRDAWRKLILSF